MAYILVLFDNVGPTAANNLTVVNLTQTAVLVRIPPGDGTGHSMQVWCVPASSFCACATARAPHRYLFQVIISPVPLTPGMSLAPVSAPAQASNIIYIDYASPSITSVTPSYGMLPSAPLTASTVGGYTMTLIGYEIILCVSLR